MRKIIFRSFIIFIIVFTITMFSIQPKIDRNWSLDQRILPEVTIAGDDISIRNIRNFSYASTTEYTPAYYDRTVNLQDLERVDYIVEPFGNIGAAHTFLSFGFSDGSQLAISVEIRKEVGESFSPIKGVLRRYELMYVIADERDVVNLRANHRRHDVFLYPTLASKEHAQTLFLTMLERTERLRTKPEFYNTVWNNCTTNIASHINDITPNRVPLDFRLLFPENSDVLAHELGLIAPEMSIEEARQRYRINERAKGHNPQLSSLEFSQLLRTAEPLRNE